MVQHNMAMGDEAEAEGGSGGHVARIIAPATDVLNRNRQAPRGHLIHHKEGVAFGYATTNHYALSSGSLIQCEIFTA